MGKKQITAGVLVTGLVLAAGAVFPAISYANEQEAVANMQSAEQSLSEANAKLEDTAARKVEAQKLADAAKLQADSRAELIASIGSAQAAITTAAELQLPTEESVVELKAAQDAALKAETTVGNQEAKQRIDKVRENLEASVASEKQRRAEEQAAAEAAQAAAQEAANAAAQQKLANPPANQARPQVQQQVQPAPQNRAPAPAPGPAPQAPAPAPAPAANWVAEAQQILIQVGGAGIPFETGTCKVSNIACAWTDGRISVEAGWANQSQYMKVWSMAHELAHIYQFRVYGPLKASPTYQSLFGGDIEALANAMTTVRGYPMGSYSQAQLNYAAGIYNGQY